jgi:hypothetical protein
MKNHGCLLFTVGLLLSIAAVGFAAVAAFLGSERIVDALMVVFWITAALTVLGALMAFSGQWQEDRQEKQKGPP